MQNTRKENGLEILSPDKATASELAQALGAMPIDELRIHQAELAAAVAELAQSAGQPWPGSHDDPVVALLRVLARLSIQAPDVTSAYASSLVGRLAVKAGATEPQESVEQYGDADFTVGAKRWAPHRPSATMPGATSAASSRWGLRHN